MCTHRELHHSYFIYYGHGTPENCVIHINPPANAFKWYMAWLANNEIKVTWNTKAMCTIKWWWGQEAGRNVRMGVCWGGSNGNSEQTTESLEWEEKTDWTEARRGEDLFLTAALSSVSKQASLMHLCPVLTARHRGYTTVIAAKTRTGRNKQREWVLKMIPPRYL